MIFEKSITINIGNWESVKLGVSEASSFEECDKALDAELIRLNLKHRGLVMHG